MGLVRTWHGGYVAEMTQAGRFLPEPREVVLWLPEQTQLVGVIGLLEAFDAANRFAVHAGGGPLYRLSVVGRRAGVGSPAGALLQTPAATGEEPVHTLVVGGTFGGGEPDPVLARLLERAERRVSICAGAFWLGAQGALDGRRCTTHWLALAELGERFPAARIEPDALFVEDGDLWTSAGATAGIDLALELISRDGGRRLARSVARSLVVFAQRPGGQSQFSLSTRARPAGDERIRTLVREVVADPAGEHTVPDLARRAGMSERHFARVFREQIGQTPAAFVVQARVEAAQRLLVAGDEGLEWIAEQVGLGTVQTLRRAFTRTVGVAPSAWRARFR